MSLEPIFTIPYPEFAVAKHLEHLLKKGGDSIAFPASRQNKGWDLLVFREKTGRAARIQVKSSRGYAGLPPRAFRDRLQVPLNHYLWFNRFDADRSLADFYILIGVYESPTARANDQMEAYRRLYLMFTAGEMRRFMSPVGHSFDFAFDAGSPQCIIRSKGAETRFNECYEGFGLDARIGDLAAFLNGDEPRAAQLLPHGLSAPT